MASTKEYRDFILEQLSELDEVSFRAMMGEYILYYRGRVFGGIYDDRLLVKPVPSAVKLMPALVLILAGIVFLFIQGNTTMLTFLLTSSSTKPQNLWSKSLKTKSFEFMLLMTNASSNLDRWYSEEKIEL